MNPRYTLIVFLVFVAMAAFAWTQRDTESRQVGEGAPTPTPEALLELDPASVAEVLVQGEAGEYTLARVGAGWEVDGEEASDEVDGLVTRLAAPSVIRELPADRNPDDYGFATPSLTVTLRTAAGEDTVIQVGDETPTDFNVYIRLSPGSGGAERIVIVSNSDFERLRDWLDAPPFAPTPTPEVTEGEGAVPGDVLGDEVIGPPGVTPEGGTDLDAEADETGEGDVDEGADDSGEGDADEGDDADADEGAGADAEQEDDASAGTPTP